MNEINIHICTKYQAPHQVRDMGKLESMIDALLAGESLPPVLVCGEIAYSGSHRLVAWANAGLEPSVVEMTDGELIDVMEAIGLEPGYDEIQHFDEFVEMARSMGLAGDAE